MKKEETVKDFQKKKYLERLKIFSKLREGKSSAYLYLVATLISLSVLIFFAIGPTIGTITELQKKLADSKMADEALTKKIADLESLKRQYGEISADIPFITSALPESPLPTDLMGRIQALATTSNVVVERLSTSDIPLSNNPSSGEVIGGAVSGAPMEAPSGTLMEAPVVAPVEAPVGAIGETAGVAPAGETQSDPSFLFSVSVSGDYASTVKFFETLANFDRILTISSFSLSRDEGSTRVLNIEGKAYYQP